MTSAHHHERSRSSVLVVEDEGNMLKTLAAILRRNGYDVSVAADGETAVHSCRSQSFDIVLMDVRMPRMDGIQAFRRIHELQSETRVILMSAYGESHVKNTVLEEGVVAFLDKPVNIDALLRIMEDLDGPTVLIVSHDATVLRTVRRLIEHRGHVVTTSLPGESLSLAEQLRFDLILIDTDQRDMNGLELYLSLRRRTQSAVCVMLAEPNDESRRIAREAVQRTAYAVVGKPIDEGELLKLYDRIRGQSNSTALTKPEPS